MGSAPPLILYCVIVSGLTTAEWRQDRRAQYFHKPLAAFGFLVLAVQAGALDSPYGQRIFAALTACALGDILLLFRTSQKLFIAGMAAFAVGHSLYAFAFWQGGVSGAGLMSGAAMAVVLLSVFIVTLWRHISENMRGAVAAYMVIIAAMIITGFGYGFEKSLWAVVVGASVFALSDICVAKDRFVGAAPWHPFIITPLYFGAQALFALSV